MRQVSEGGADDDHLGQAGEGLDHPEKMVKVEAVEGPDELGKLMGGHGGGRGLGDGFEGRNFEGSGLGGCGVCRGVGGVFCHPHFHRESRPCFFCECLEMNRRPFSVSPSESAFFQGL